MIQRMDDSRKSLPQTAWAVALLVLVIAYPLSVGPWEWLGARDMIPHYVTPVLQFIYWPVAWLYENSPDPVRDAMQWYLDFWVP
jgi:hypothetical protein